MLNGLYVHSFSSFTLQFISRSVTSALASMSAPQPSFPGGQGPGVASTPRPLDDAPTRLAMQRSLDFFDHYWTGRGREWADLNAQGLREPIYSQMQVPRTRAAPRDPGAKPPGAPTLVFDMDRRVYGGLQDRTQNRQLRRQVAAGEFGIVNFTQPLNLELKRVLGKGGQGIACLFILTLPDGTKKQMVVKASLNAGDIGRELRNMRVSATMHCTRPLF